MHRHRVFAVALAMLIVSQVDVLGDWKSELARRAVGRAAQAGIQEAVEDAARDVAFDAALGAGLRIEDRERIVMFGSNAGAAVEAAMTAADVASTLDAAADAAEVAKKVNRARKAIGRFR